MKKTLIYFFTLLLLCQTGFSKQWIVFSGEYIHKNALVGHTYVSFFEKNEEVQQTVHVGSWGFYPKKKETKILWGSIVPGTIKDDYSTQKDASVTIEVTSEEYNLCLAVVDRWKRQVNELNLKYQLYNNNCISFVRDVANVLCRIQQPHGMYFTPSLFIDELKSLNYSVNIESQYSLSNNEINFGEIKAKNLFLNNNTELFEIDKNHTPYKYGLLVPTSNNQLALLGKYPVGINVLVINHKTRKATLCKTVSVRYDNDDSNERQVITVLDKKQLYNQSDNNFNHFNAILYADNITYKEIDKYLLQDKQQIENIDNEIRQNKYLEQLLEEFENEESVQAYMNSLNDIKPKIYNLKISGIDIKVITYGWEYAAGPRLLMINSKIIPLNGSCSSVEFQAYKYGNNYFIKSNSGKCESGYIFVKVFEIKEDDVIEEFSDSGYSN